jgi:hypothetical protein
MKEKFSFKGKMKKNAESRKKGFSYGYLNIPKGIEMFSVTAPSNIVMDIIPYLVTDKNHPDKDTEAEIAVEGSYWYKRPYKIHRSIGVNNATIICPTSIGKKCPVCEYKEKLLKSGKEYDDEDVKVLRTSERNLNAVIVKSLKVGKKTEHFEDNKISLFDFSDYLFQEKLEEQLSDKDEFETFLSLSEGYSLEVRFAEASLGANKYPEATRFDFVERDKPYKDKILEMVPNLDECLNVLPYNEIKDMFFESITDDNDNDEDEDEEEEERPKKSNSKKNNKGKRVVEEEDEDEEEDDEDEEEDEKPVQRKRKTNVNQCPNDHTFGKDTDKFEDCEDCELWNDCYAAKRKNKKA